MNDAAVMLAAHVRAVAEELVAGGIHDVVICPGSRSTPLALAFEAEPRLKTWIHLDERAAAFFALGLAKASRRAAGVLSTSGTAAANLLPAIVEASHGRVPLLVITADRPPELQDRGANQTIDQVHLYGRFVRWFAQLPLPDDGAPGLADVRGVVGRAVGTSMGRPAGPVHLNAPLREPLVPDGALVPDEVDSAVEAVPPHLAVALGRRRLVQQDLSEVAVRLGASERPLIVCGPLDEPGFAPAVARLAASVGAPILADALSNTRLGSHDRSHVIGRHDAIARSARVLERLVPDEVVRFGATPTSKALVAMLKAQAAPQIVVDEGGWTEATTLPGTLIDADPTQTADALAALLEQGRPQAGPTAWLSSWLAADEAAAAAVRRRLATFEDPFEGAVFAQLEGQLPDGTVLVAGNSMPVRDMDAFLAPEGRDVRTLGNRGASGIDGVVSTALGVAAASDGPVVLVVGDVAFIHDLNALVALRAELPALTIVLVDNDGGGIFSFLPQAYADRPEVGLPASYERLFGTPHGIDLEAIVGAFGVEHRHLEGTSIGAAVAASIATPGIRLLELRTDRARNVTLHGAVTTAVVAAVDQTLAS